MLDARGEALRKLIHAASSLAAAACVWGLPRPIGAITLAVAAGVAVGVELTRQLHAPFNAWFERRLGVLLRPAEHRRITGAATLALGYALTAAFFPAVVAVTAILVTGIADALAAVVGKRFGRMRYPGGKSLEGSVVFFVVAWALVMGVAGVGPGTAAMAAFIATLLEAPTFPVDDNLFLPLVSAAGILGAIWLSAMGGFS